MRLCHIAVLSVLAGAVPARADEGIVLLLVPAEREAAFAEALRIELAGRTLRVEVGPPPEAATLADGDRNAATAARALGAGAAFYLDLSGGPLRPPTLRYVAADGSAARHALLPAALDVVEPGAFGVIAVSLIDDAEIPTLEEASSTARQDPSAQRSAASNRYVASASTADPTVPVEEEGAGEPGAVVPPVEDPGPRLPAGWVVRVPIAGGFLSGPADDAIQGGSLGASFAIGRYIDPHFRLEAGFGMFTTFEEADPLIGDLWLGAAGLVHFGRLSLELGAGIDLGIAGDRMGVGGSGWALLVHRTTRRFRMGLGPLYNVWRGIARQGLTHSGRAMFVMEIAL